MQLKFSAMIFLATFACSDEAVVSAAPAELVVNGAEAPPPPADVDVALPGLPEGKAIDVELKSSSIQFVGAKITGSHVGGFDAFTGKIVIKDDVVIATHFEIDLSSTTADNPKLMKHLISKDFFNAEKYGTATFVSSAVIAADNPGAVTHRVEGVLDFHGKRRPLAFPASIQVGQAATTVSATFDINRQNWGVSYPGKKDDLIKDDVQIDLALSFPMKAE
jgi:polyisoprenoid-binding protein YceI